MIKYIKYFGLVLIVYLIGRLNLNYLLKNIISIKVDILLIAIFLNIPAIFLKSFRWNILLKSQSINLSLKKTFFTYLASLYIGIVTPGRIGEFTKPIFLKLNKNVSLSMGMSSTFVDRLFDLYLLMIIGIIGILKFKIFGIMTGSSVITIGLILIMSTILLNKTIMLKIRSLFLKLKIIEKYIYKLNGRYDDYYSGIQKITNIKIIYPILLTCISYFIHFIQCYLLILALEIQISLPTIIMFTSITNLISLIPVSISGLGTRDTALIYLFSLIGIKAEFAVTYSFWVFINFYVTCGILGLMALLKE